MIKDQKTGEIILTKGDALRVMLEMIQQITASGGPDDTIGHGLNIACRGQRESDPWGCFCLTSKIIHPSFLARVVGHNNRQIIKQMDRWLEEAKSRREFHAASGLPPAEGSTVPTEKEIKDLELHLALAKSCQSKEDIFTNPDPDLGQPLNPGCGPFPFPSESEDEKGA